MKILLLGSGGRECAFAWKLSQSDLCTKLYIAPGNAGTSSYGDNVAISPTDFDQLKQFCIDQSVDMVVVGPEDPLVKGIYDFFKQDKDLCNIAVIGPSQQGAQLEGSKDFAKKFMQRYKIPTAAYASFTKSQLQDGLHYIDKQNLPIVLKADGLAAGKGVLICENHEEAKRELKIMLEGAKFGVASETVVIEQFLKGIELSVFILTDGHSYKILPEAKDYKRIGEGDTGLNTGGMGSISPVPFADATFMQKVEDRIIKPTVKGLQDENIAYNGFLFIGLMNVSGEPYVIEYNVRMGDPETESVLPRIKSDLVVLLKAITDGNLAEQVIETDTRTAATVMLVSKGYPGNYEKGKTISGLETIKDSLLFHAGTIEKDKQILTSGGRVLAVTSLGENLPKALALSNKNAALVQFDGKYFRKDIGFDLI